MSVSWPDYEPGCAGQRSWQRGVLAAFMLSCSLQSLPPWQTHELRCLSASPMINLALQAGTPGREGRERLLERMLRDVADTSPMTSLDFQVRWRCSAHLL